MCGYFRECAAIKLHIRFLSSHLVPQLCGRGEDCVWTLFDVKNSLTRKLSPVPQFHTFGRFRVYQSSLLGQAIPYYFFIEWSLPFTCETYNSWQETKLSKSTVNLVFSLGSDWVIYQLSLITGQSPGFATTTIFEKADNLTARKFFSLYFSFRFLSKSLGVMLIHMEAEGNPGPRHLVRLSGSPVKFFSLFLNF